LYDSGCRVQELCDIQIGDIITGNNPTVKLHGKGRKYRIVVISDRTAQLVDEYIQRQRARALTGTPLLINRSGQKMS
ncbi:hypothetical protein DCD76_18620, partial [Acinetobacter baumannii]|uniref:tyrosine-type recombinase/integrase n=1 Tax=Acinetobacter baumannii TaxID=470 RepID=UPI000DE779F7